MVEMGTNLCISTGVKYLFINSNNKKTLHRPPEKYQGQNIMEFYGPEDSWQPANTCQVRDRMH